MKLLQRILILVCAFLILTTTKSLAQITESDEKHTSNTKLWHNNFYLIFSYAVPVGKWSQTPDATKTITDAYLQNTGMGATRGFNFEIGSFFHFKRMSPIMHDRFKLGLNVSYLDGSVIFINPRWRSIGGAFASTSTSYQPFYFWGVKLGMTGTFSVAKHMFVDLYANVYPTFSLEGEVNVSDGTNTIHGHSTGVGYGTRGTVGINYRVLVFNFGIEMVFGNIMYNTSVEYNNGTSTDNFKASFNTNTLKAKFGFVF